jgi:hypothetical protein
MARGIYNPFPIDWNMRKSSRSARISCLLFHAAALCLVARQPSLAESQPPAHRHEEFARSLMESALDASDLRDMDEFFLRPLSVPSGELRLLDGRTSVDSDAFLLSAEDLAAYEPWDSVSIARFFGEFPELLVFSAILSFDPVQPHFAHVQFSSTGIGQKSASQYSRFSIKPSHAYRLDGSIKISENQARWQRRTLNLRAGRAFLALGNYGTSFDKGLFYGWFPSASVRKDDVRENWLYGSSRTWNGVHARLHYPGPARLTALAHHQSKETAGAVFARVKAEKVAWGSGASYCIARDSATDSSLIIHADGELAWGDFYCALYTGIHPAAPRLVPVSFHAGFRDGRRGWRLHMATLPSGFSAPRSRLLHRINYYLDQEQKISPGAGLVECTVFDSLLHLFRTQAQFRYAAGGGKSHVASRITVEGCLLVDFRLAYTYALDAEFAKRHGIAASFSRRLGKSVLAESDWRIRKDAEGVVRKSMALRSIVTWNQTVSIEPFFAISHARKQKADMEIGFCQYLLFFDRTNGEISCRMPLAHGGNERIALSANAGFLF